MKIVVVAAVIAIAAWQINARLKSSVAVKGDAIVVEAGSVSAHLQAGAAVEETMVLFGADPGAVFGDALISGLPLKRARALYSEHPDLGRCDSPGKSEVHNAMVVFNLVAAGNPVRKSLDEVRASVKERVGTNASRVCLTVKGKKLSVQSIDHSGTPVTFDDGAIAGHLLVEFATARDCSQVLGEL